MKRPRIIQQRLCILCGLCGLYGYIPLSECHENEHLIQPNLVTLCILNMSRLQCPLSRCLMGYKRVSPV